MAFRVRLDCDALFLRNPDDLPRLASREGAALD